VSDPASHVSEATVPDIVAEVSLACLEVVTSAEALCQEITPSEQLKECSQLDSIGSTAAIGSIVCTSTPCHNAGQSGVCKTVSDPASHVSEATVPDIVAEVSLACLEVVTSAEAPCQEITTSEQLKECSQPTPIATSVRPPLGEKRSVLALRRKFQTNVRQLEPLLNPGPGTSIPCAATLPPQDPCENLRESMPEGSETPMESRLPQLQMPSGRPPKHLPPVLSARSTGSTGRSPSLAPSSESERVSAGSSRLGRRSPEWLPQLSARSSLSSAGSRSVRSRSPAGSRSRLGSCRHSRTLQKRVTLTRTAMELSPEYLPELSECSKQPDSPSVAPQTSEGHWLEACGWRRLDVSQTLRNYPTPSAPAMSWATFVQARTPTSSAQCGTPQAMPMGAVAEETPKSSPTSSAQCGVPQAIPIGARAEETSKCSYTSAAPTLSWANSVQAKASTSSAQCGTPQGMPIGARAEAGAAVSRLASRLSIVLPEVPGADLGLVKLAKRTPYSARPPETLVSLADHPHQLANLGRGQGWGIYGMVR